MAAILAFAVFGDGGQVTPYPAVGPPQAPLRRFVLMSDTQYPLDVEVWEPLCRGERTRLIRAVAEENPAFVVNAGDLVDRGSQVSSWERFYEDHRPLVERGIPYHPAIGNHDYYGPNDAALENFFSAFPDLEGRTWYEVRVAPVSVLVLNSNFDELRADEAAAQDRWLEDRLQACESDADIRAVIVVCHHPPYTNALRFEDDEAVQARFVSRLTPKVKIFFSGHIHAYERFFRRGIHFVVAGGAGGPPAPLKTWRPRHDDARASRMDAFHYVRVTVEPDRLLAEVPGLTNDGWELLDVFEADLRKDPPPVY